MNAFWQKALEMADEARLVLASGHFNGAASRAYYAMFNAARAALETTANVDPADVRRHSAVLKMFSQHVVKAGLIEREVGAAINEAFEVRAIGDYDRASVSEGQARAIVATTERMLRGLAPLVDREREP